MELSREAVFFVLAVVFFSQKGKRTGTVKRPLGPEWSDEEMFIFANHVRRTGVRVADALAVYTAESNLDPKATSGVAWGIPQMTAATLKDLKWSEPASDFAKLSVADQAPWIEQLLEYQKKIIGFTPQNALDLYVANFSPAAAKSKANIIYDSRKPSELAAYEANAGLDTAHKGYIDRADLKAYLKSWVESDTYARALEQLQKVEHVSEPTAS